MYSSSIELFLRSKYKHTYVFSITHNFKNRKVLTVSLSVINSVNAREDIPSSSSRKVAKIGLVCDSSSVFS